MNRKTTLAAATVLAAALSLTACGSDDAAEADTTSTGSSSQEQQAETPDQPVSESVVETFTSALDDLGIEHAEPERRKAEPLSGVQMRFDMPVNGYDAGINIFPDEETLVAWQEASDALGGIHVALPDANAVLTLNSTEGIADSGEIAPRIAEAVGGTAHGV